MKAQGLSVTTRPSEEAGKQVIDGVKTKLLGGNK